MSIDLKFEKPVDGELLTSELALALGPEFESLSVGEDGVIVSLADDTPDEARTLAEEVVDAHRRPAVTKAEERQLLQMSVGQLLGAIDFEQLDARIETLDTPTAVRGLSRAAYVLAVAGGFAPLTERAVSAAKELAEFFGVAQVPTPEPEPVPDVKDSEATIEVEAVKRDQ